MGPQRPPAYDHDEGQWSLGLAWPGRPAVDRRGIALLAVSGAEQEASVGCDGPEPVAGSPEQRETSHRCQEHWVPSHPAPGQENGLSSGEAAYVSHYPQAATRLTAQAFPRKDLSPPGRAYRSNLHTRSPKEAGVTQRPRGQWRWRTAETGKLPTPVWPEPHALGQGLCWRLGSGTTLKGRALWPDCSARGLG